MAKTEKLRREIQQLRADVSEKTHTAPALRVIFELWDMEGKQGYADIQGQPCEKDPEAICFTMRSDMLQLLVSGEDIILLHGGRDSAKSGCIGRYIVARMITGRERVLIIRDSRQSQIESVQRLVMDVIESEPKLNDFFPIEDRLKESITAINGSSMKFLGLRDHRSVAVQSIQGISICWVEESQSLGKGSWVTLEPSIREPGSQIFLSMNATRDTDVIYQNFIAHLKDYAAVGMFNYTGNPWVSEKSLRQAAEMQKSDPALYEHVWMGGLRQFSEARILDRVRVEHFNIEDVIDRRITIECQRNIEESSREHRERISELIQAIENNFFVGCDFGASENHPAAMVEAYLDDSPAKTIYVLNEAYGPAKDIRKYLEMAREIPRLAEGWPMRCDDARPDLIDYLTRNGINATGAQKGRVEERIDILREYEIVIHPRCENCAREIPGWSYRTDSTGEVLPVPDKKNDHSIDSLSYAVIKAARTGGVGYEQISEEW